MSPSALALREPDPLAGKLLPEQRQLAVEARLTLARQAMAHRHLPDAIRYCRRALGLHPDDPAVLAEYAHMLDCAGRLDEAVEASEAALALDPSLQDVLLRLVSLHRRLGRVNEAIALLVARLRHDGANVALFQVLAGLLVHENRFDDALKCIDRALAIEPSNRKLLWQMLDLAARLGRFNRIRRCLSHLVEVDPQSGKAHRMLAEMSQYQTGHPHLNAMEIAYAARFADKPNRAQLAFGLFRAFDQLGQHERAFGFLSEANEIMAELQRGSGRVPIADMTTLRATYARTLFLANRADARSGPVFIIGLPFSGRQALARLLGPHSTQKAEALTGLTAGLLRSLSLGPAQGAGWERAVPEDKLKALARSYAERIGSKGDGAIASVEIVPDGHLVLGLLRLAMPDARFIHCQRSALPHCFALYAGQPDGDEAGWTNDLASIGKVHAAYRDCMAQWKSVTGEAILDIDHDGLLAGDAETLNALAGFLGLGPDAFAHAHFPLWCWPPTGGFRLAPYIPLLDPLLDAIKGKTVHKMA